MLGDLYVPENTVNTATSLINTCKRHKKDSKNTCLYSVFTVFLQCLQIGYSVLGVSIYTTVIIFKEGYK